MRVEEELTKAHIEAKFAWDKGATESQMKNVLKLLRQAQWRWDFAVASHGAAFHAPQEVTRILGSGLDKATQARIQIMKVLAQLGIPKMFRCRISPQKRKPSNISASIWKPSNRPNKSF